MALRIVKQAKAKDIQKYLDVIPYIMSNSNIYQYNNNLNVVG